MRKADKLMVESISTIQEFGHKDVNPRPKWPDGTPAYTLSVNGVVHRYNIDEGEFPITLLRPIAFKKAIKEILWIYQDATSDLTVLEEKHDIHWWNEWDIGDHTIGHCYGNTVARYQLMEKLIAGIKKDPYSRRHIINLWQEEEFQNLHGLKPCCYQIQCLIRGDYLDMLLYQRSSDWLVSGNINQMQYVALQMMIAKATEYRPGEFIHIMANQQIYDRHMEQADELLRRYREETLSEKEPKLLFHPKSDVFSEFTVDDFTLEDYEPIRPQLTFEVAI